MSICLLTKFDMAYILSLNILLYLHLAKSGTKSLWGIEWFIEINMLTPVLSQKLLLKLVVCIFSLCISK